VGGIGGVGDLSVSQAFVNSGAIVLSGTANLLTGGAITSSGSISGRGQIANAVVNSGTISQTLPGELEIVGTVQNLTGGVITVGSGSMLTVNLTANNGTVNVNAGGILSTGVFTNSARVNVSGTLDADGINNTGTIAYNGAGSIDSFGPIANNPGGAITVTATGGVLVYDNLSHAPGAALSVAAGATVNFLGNVSGDGAVTNHGTLNLASGKTYALGQISGSGSVVLFDGAQLTATRITQAALTLNASGTSLASVAVAPSGAPASVTSKVGHLSIAGGATPQARLDLANTNLVVDYTGATQLPAVRDLIRAGYNPGGAHWTGQGITSSLAAVAGTMLGYGEASDVLGLSGTSAATWNGQTVDATSVLVRYTLGGDATLDGVVDFNDLVNLAQNYNASDGNRLWTEADFDYDGNVGFGDLVLLAQNYNGSLPGAVPGAPADFQSELAAAFARVPEPGAAVALVGLGAIFLRRRRRR
jgi:hypothetical protein